MVINSALHVDEHSRKSLNVLAMKIKELFATARRDVTFSGLQNTTFTPSNRAGRQT